MTFRPELVLFESMRYAKSNRLASARHLIEHYQTMVSLGASRADRPNYLKRKFKSDAEMISAIEKIIEKKTEQNS